MTRNEFLGKLGMGAAFVLTCTCFGSCGNDDDGGGSGPVDFTIDLTDAQFAALQQNGSYVVFNDTVIARGLNGGYLAATVICSHEQFKQITYSENQGKEIWLCTKHGAQYELDGTGINEEGMKGLTIYNTSKSADDMLRVFS